MKDLLNFFEIPYVDCQTLLVHLSEYRNPRDWIARKVEQGELLRLKNGFFLIASWFQRRGIDYPYEQIANCLYGPSYISLEWALSFYNFIPERVSVVTSVTTGRVKEYETPIGAFSYTYLSQSRYCVGVNQKKIAGQLGGVLIATPEKALADWIFFSCKNMPKEEILEDFLVAKRIEKESLELLDKKVMREISREYKSKTVKILSEIIEDL